MIQLSWEFSRELASFVSEHEELHDDLKTWQLIYMSWYEERTVYHETHKGRKNDKKKL